MDPGWTTRGTAYGNGRPLGRGRIARGLTSPAIRGNLRGELLPLQLKRGPRRSLPRWSVGGFHRRKQALHVLRRWASSICSDVRVGVGSEVIRAVTQLVLHVNDLAPCPAQDRGIGVAEVVNAQRRQASPFQGL